MYICQIGVGVFKQSVEDGMRHADMLIYVWFGLQGILVDILHLFNTSWLPFRVSQISRIIRFDIMRLDIEQTWISHTQKLRLQKIIYKDHHLHLREDGFTASNVPYERYMHLLISCRLRKLDMAHIASLRSSVLASYVTRSQRHRSTICVDAQCSVRSVGDFIAFQGGVWIVGE